MEINHLRYFFEVAKAGSFTAAARKLRISQSALSKAVALLEDAEGVKLLERTKKGVSLTQLGSEVFNRSEEIFRTLSEIENTCRGKKETCEGYLRFGASDHLTNYVLLKKVAQMRMQHPKLIPSIFSGTPHDMVGQILSNEIEFALFFTKINVPGITYETLFPVEMAVVCSPKFSDANPKLKKIIQTNGFIGSIKAQYQNHPSQDLMNVLGEDPNIAFESNSQEAQKRFAMLGGGVAFLAKFMVEEELDKGKLVEIPLSKPLRLDLHLARSTGRALSLSARTFLEMIRT